jgi:L-aminopeptidase/D-esterase-like protein
VGVVRDAVIAWQHEQGGGWKESLETWSLPLVAETWDGYLNDIHGFHVKAEHAFEALDNARGGLVAEGNVGGGTGMICNEFKGGIGTASRVLPKDAGGYTVGVLVQCNYGLRPNLLIAGVPVGREIPEEADDRDETGSIIIVVATDAPLMAHQVKRLIRRSALGLGRTGSIASNGSGDIFVAFSTANPGAAEDKKGLRTLTMLPNGSINGLFLATVQATEEAIVNAMVAAETMVGRDHHKVEGLPHDKLRAVLKKYNRLKE